ncbi:MAG TPA: hypothetical protein VHD81_04270 [Mycobacteriales bacterium]|nr:hypothetical protein [Mycobacteriales bacterium]
MISPQAALAIATMYVADRRPGAMVIGLYEDSADYLADPHCEGPTPVGESWIFVIKSSGEVHEIAPVEVLHPAFAMTKVPLG